MKVEIYVDELYPYYGFTELKGNKPTTGSGHVVRITEDTLYRWHAVLENFRNFQDELEKLKRQK